MFGRGHPQPPHRKEVAMQIVQQRQRTFDAHHVLVDPPGGTVMPEARAAALEFDVACTLPEYLGFLHDHLACILRQRPRAQRLRQLLVPAATALLAGGAAWWMAPGWLATACTAASVTALGFLPATAAAWVVLIGTPVFFLKQRRGPVSTFRIDAAGVSTTSRAGTRVRAWSEIEGIRHYRRGYLLMTGMGGLAIPSRCLDARMQGVLRRLAAGKRGMPPSWMSAHKP